MIRYRKKIVVFLITVALGGGVLLLCSAQSAPNAEKHASPQVPRTPYGGVLRANRCGTELENSPVLASQQMRAKSQTGSIFENDPNFSTRAFDGFSTRELFFKMMVSVLFLVALGAAAMYISKRFLPKFTNLPGKEIRITETVHLGQRKAVHLLEVGEQRFLIGSTNENITKLADLEMEANEVPKV